MFDWRDNLVLASSLGTGAPGSSVAIPISEATDRCAVGRAYYAAFCHARTYATRNLGFSQLGNAGDHGRLAAHFQMHGMHQVARALGRLRNWRNACDYDNVVPTLPTMVRDALRDATSVIQRL